MTLQKKVYEKQATGVVGDFADNSPKRVAAYVVRANSDKNPLIGCACTLKDKDNEAQIGGSGSFAGVIVGPKQYALATLETTLELPDGSFAQVCSMGRVYVVSKNAVKPGYVAAFDPATGELYAYADAAAATEAEHSLIAGARFMFYESEAGEPAILELNS